MNIVFYALIILLAGAVWFVAAPIFKPLGRAISKRWSKTIDILNDEEKEEKEN